MIQVCHTMVRPTIEGVKMGEEGLEIEGIAVVSVIYLSQKETRPYEIIKKEIPFSYILENAAGGGEYQWKISAMVEQCNSIILEEDKLEVKLVLALDILLADCWRNSWIKNIRIEPYTEEEMEETPGILVYIPSKNEVLWDIGKKYGISQEAIRNLNQLTKPEVERGQKLLLVRDFSVR